jgi:general secretion pathway protein D
MSILNRLAGLLAVTAVLLACVSPLAARTKQGEKLIEAGRLAEANQDYDKALELFTQAAATDPQDPVYRLLEIRARYQSAQGHIDRGLRIRKEGRLEEALLDFQKAKEIDPSITSADQEMKRTREMIERSKKRSDNPAPGAAPETAEERGLTPAQAARRESERRVDSLLAMPELRPINNQITNLKMTNQPPKVLYETVGKLAGINVLFDQEYLDQSAARKTTLDLGNTTLEEALDYIALLTKSYWKPLSANAIFVTADNVTKRRDYEEHVTRVFYLQNLTTPQELQEALSAVRTISDVRKVFPYAAQNAILVRGTYDQVLLAEKLINDIDKPKAEVVVDVYVMEANRTKTRDLANTLVSGGNPGLVLPISPITAAAAAGSVASSGVPLGLVGQLGWNNWAVTMPGYLLQAVMSDSQTRLLQAPQVRATDGQKASLRLGDRYPYATGSFQPGVGSVGVSPLVSTQFQFADVGVNVDVTPRIHGTDEVSLQVELEISAIKQKIDVGGLQQPVIGQRKVNHIVRVKEGEVTLVGGLMNMTDSLTRSGVPGLMNLPGIGKWFSSEHVERDSQDLLVALVPHIVRRQEVTAENMRTIASGTDTIWRLNMAPRPSTGGAGALAAPAQTQPPPQFQQPAPAPGQANPLPLPTQLPGLPTGPAAAPMPSQPMTISPMNVAPITTAPITPKQTPAQTPAPPPPAPPTAQLNQPPAASNTAVTPWQQLAPQGQGMVPQQANPAQLRTGPEVQGTSRVSPMSSPTPRGGPVAESVTDGARLALSASSPESGVNSTVTVNVNVENVTDLFSAPLKVRYDNKVLKLVEVTRGGFLGGDGQEVSFSETKVTDPGGAVVTMNRVPGAGGISGSGALLFLKFQTLGAGSSEVTVSDVVLRDSKLQVIPVQQPTATITVK